VNAAEVLIRKMNRQRKLEIVELLAKRVRQAREAAKRHSHSQVLPFDVAGRNVALAGVTDSHLGYNLDDWPWGVPFIAVLAVIAIQLHKLREVNVQPERILDSIPVERESVGGELHLIPQTARQIADKTACAVHRALSDEVGSNQLGFRIHSHKNPLVADLVRVGIASDAALFLLNEGPDFVALDIATAKVAQSGIEQARTALSNHFQETQDGVPVQPRESFGAADRAALNKTLDRPCRSILVGTHGPKRRLRLGLAEGNFAGIAAPALDSTLAVGTEPLAGFVLTSGTSHGVSPLDFGGEKPHTHFGSGVRLTPRSGLAPQPVQAGSGALIVKGYPLGWYNGYFHRWTVSSEANLNHYFHCVPPFSLRSVFSALGGLYLHQKSLSLPSVVNISVLQNLRFHLVGLCQTLQDRVNGGKGIGISTHVVAIRDEQVANRDSVSPMGRILSQNISYRVRKTGTLGDHLFQFLQSFGAFGFRQEICIGRDQVGDPLNLRVQLVAFNNHFFEPITVEHHSVTVLRQVHVR